MAGYFIGKRPKGREKYVLKKYAQLSFFLFFSSWLCVLIILVVIENGHDAPGWYFALFCFMGLCYEFGQEVNQIENKLNGIEFF